MEPEKKRHSGASPLLNVPHNVYERVNEFLVEQSFTHTTVDPQALPHWQKEFNRSSALQGPGIAQVITDSVRTAYLLQDGSLFLNTSTNWSESWHVKDESVPYNSVHRMWPHLEKLKSVSFGARDGWKNIHMLLLTESNKLYTINDRLETPRSFDNVPQGKTPKLVACGRDTSATIFTDTADNSFLHRRNNKDAVLHTGVETDIIRLPGQPTHMVICRSTVVMLINNKLYYSGQRVDLGFTGIYVYSPQQKCESFTVNLQDPEDDFIKDICSSGLYVAALSAKGQVHVFGNAQIPATSSTGNRNQQSPDESHVTLPDDKQGAYISCSATSMAVVTTDNLLYTCYVRDAFENIARHVTPEMPNNALHRATEVPDNERVQQVFCSFAHGMTVVTVSQKTYHFNLHSWNMRPTEIPKPNRDYRWPEMGSRWYLMQDILGTNRHDERVLANDAACRGVLCWVRAALMDQARRAYVNFSSMVRYDNAHNGSNYRGLWQDSRFGTRHIHPIVFLRLFTMQPPALDERWLPIVQRVLHTVFVFNGAGAGAGAGDMSRYWPPDDVREVYFNEVYEKYGHDATIIGILNNIPQGAEWLAQRRKKPNSGQPLGLRLRLRFSPA